MKWFSSLISLACVSGVGALSGSTASPVEKIVKLIEELKANLESDAKVEQQMYDRYACWCEIASKKKAKDIEDMLTKIFMLTQNILELKGQVAVLSKDVADATGKISEGDDAQKSQTDVRKKENGEYMSEKAELEEAINALERAIKVLAAGTKTGLLQVGSGASAAARKQAMVSVLLAMPTRANLDRKQFAAIQDFAQGLETEVAEQDSGSPASATVQGILKDMYDSFTSDLESKTQGEASKQREFEDLVSSLTSKASELKELVLAKEGEKAAAEQDLAATVQELDDTTAQKDADIEFFDSMKAGCKAKNEEWTARKAARTEELKGIDEALGILTGDEARALFAKAIKPGAETGAAFLQIDVDSSMARAASRAYDALKDHARKAHSLRLAAVAASIRSSNAGHFDGVIKEIDQMIKDLKDEEAADIKQRDWCKDEYHENSEEKAETKWLIEKNAGMITKLENTIEALSDDITKTVEDIETTKAQIKQMEDERKAEHTDFQSAKKDDEMAIAILTKATEALTSYYKKHAIKMGPIQGSMKLLQAPEFEKSEFQAPDATFSDKGARKNESKGIVSILTMLIEDLKAEISNGIKDEASSQVEFEKDVAAAKKLIEDLSIKKENLETDKAKTMKKQEHEEEDKATNEKTLAANEEYLQGPKGIKPDCDWLLGAFEERRTKRNAEVDGLVTAKEYLTGAKPSMMQAPIGGLDDSKLERFGFESFRR